MIQTNAYRTSPDGFYAQAEDISSGIWVATWYGEPIGFLHGDGSVRDENDFEIGWPTE